MTPQPLTSSSLHLTPLSHVVARFHRIAFSFAALAWLLGALALLGWILNSVALRSLLSGGITMKTNASIGLTLTASALLLLLPEGASRVRLLAGRACAAGSLLIGGLTLFQYGTGINLHIDQLLFYEDPGALATIRPNRMGLPAATSLTLMGLAMLLLDFETRRGLRPSQYCAIVVGLITLVPLVGYAYSVELLYGRPGAGIAAQTAIGLLLLAIAVLCARPAAGIMAIIVAEGPGGVMARRMIIPTILVPLVLGWIRTLSEQQALVGSSTGRTLMILSIVVIFTALVWSNAHEVAHVGQERRAAVAALRDSEQRFRVALDTAPLSVYTHDRQLRYTWIHNPRPGFTVEAMLGRRDDELLPPETVAELIALKQRVLATGRGERRQIGTSIDGSKFVYDITVEPLRAPDGGVTGLTVAALDVTSIRESEQALLRAKADADAARAVAESANAAKDQFLAVLSHELRTPLTPVMTLVQMLEGDESLPSGVRENLRTIRRNIELEARLIDDLLDLTRISKGKLTLRLEDVDVHEILRHVIAMLTPDLDSKLLTFRANLAPQHFSVSGDPARLQQVFWNLLKNSIKFTPPGVSVHVDTAPTAGGLRLTFTDTGIGIDAAMLPRVFHAFEQGDPGVARQFGGLGLGLAICKAIVAMHGGTIEAASDGLGAGTVIRVTLPAAVSTAVSPVKVPGRSLDGNSLKDLCVLLVEDNPDTARALSRLLGTFGCRVTIATSVKTAVHALRAQPFDILLSDLGLPDGSGHELMAHLQHQNSIRAIAISGFGMEHDVRKSLDVGFLAHLTKPVDIGQLHKTLLAVVSAPSQTRPAVSADGQ